MVLRKRYWLFYFLTFMAFISPTAVQQIRTIPKPLTAVG
jgi:hypothetical protein